MAADGDKPKDEKKKDDKGTAGTIREIVVTIVAALVLAWVVQAYLVKPYRIPSGSMENTLRCGDRVLVDRLSYHFHSPHRQDVVVFLPPARPNFSGDLHVKTQSGAYIKRIIGLPGDSVQVKNNHAWVNGTELHEPYLHPLPPDGGANISTLNWGPHKVPKGTYLMMGDHRDDSSDGRVFGYVPRADIIGHAFFVYWPLSRLGQLPGHDPGGPKSSTPDPRCQEAQLSAPPGNQ
jgi:signal peptidase I